MSLFVDHLQFLHLSSDCVHMYKPPTHLYLFTNHVKDPSYLIILVCMQEDDKDDFEVITMKVFLYQKVSTLNPKPYSLNNTFLQIDILQKNITIEVLDNRYHHFDTSLNDIWCYSDDGITNTPFKVFFYLQSLYHTTLKSILPLAKLKPKDVK